MADVISINLDPMKDGIIGKADTVESTAGRYLVVGTNFDHRIISEKEFWAYLKAMEDAGVSHQAIMGEYLIFYDQSKVITVSGDDYLVGSFLLVKPSGDSNVFTHMSDEDIEGVKEDISGYFSELIINGERYDALAV